jgi:CheY-like chemotaxis protein
VARDSDEAHNCLSEESLAAVVVEMKLQPDDGFVLLEKVLSLRRPVPVFLVAASPLPESITRAFKEGVTDFIPKPLVPEVVVAKLKKEIEEIHGVSQLQPAEEEVASVETISTGGETPGDILIEVEPENETSAVQDEPLPTPSSISYSGVGSKGGILTGSLEGKTALSLIRALVAKKRTGELALRYGEKKGILRFENGHVFQAMFDEIQGEEAFLELASWHDCLYRFNSNEKPKKREIRTSTAKLLRIAALDS